MDVSQFHMRFCAEGKEIRCPISQADLGWLLSRSAPAEVAHFGHGSHVGMISPGAVSNFSIKVDESKRKSCAIKDVTIPAELLWGISSVGEALCPNAPHDLTYEYVASADP